MPPVKGQLATVRERLELLRQLFAEPPVEKLTNEEFAAVLGPDYTEDQLKSWPKDDRPGIPLPARLRIIEVANDRGVVGVTRQWLEDGTGARPRKGGAVPPGGSQGARSVGERLPPPVPLRPSTEQGQAEREGGVVATEDGGEVIAQRMLRHWKKIAESNELTGPDLLDLLEDEARWFRVHGYWSSYDSTINVIREIRAIETKRWDGKDPRTPAA